MKKVYFACSIKGGGDKADIPKIADIIRKYSTILSEAFLADIYNPEGSLLSKEKIWERDLEWVEEADVMIADVSNPSLGVGYEIAKAEEMNKPVLCLYKKKDAKLSAMIGGSPKLKVVEYESVTDLEEPIKQFLSC
jgi:hypothetical protein